MVNESKNMYIPEDTLENHQGMWCPFLFFFLLITDKHLVTVHERGKEVEGGREGDDLEMGMGWGKRRWKEEGREGRQ